MYSYRNNKRLKRLFLLGTLCMGHQSMLMPAWGDFIYNHYALRMKQEHGLLALCFLGAGFYAGKKICEKLESRRTEHDMGIPASQMVAAGLLAGGVGSSLGCAAIEPVRKFLEKEENLGIAIAAGMGVAIAGGYTLCRDLINWEIYGNATIRNLRDRARDSEADHLRTVLAFQIERAGFRTENERLHRAYRNLENRVRIQNTDLAGDERQLTNNQHRANQIALKNQEIGTLRDKLRTAKQKGKTAKADLMKELRELFDQKNRTLDDAGVQRPTCPVCFEEKPHADFVLLACRHSGTCRECMSGVINNALDSNNPHGIVCTKQDCGRELTDDDIACIAGEQAKDLVCRKHELLLKQLLAVDGAVQCPTPDCKAVFYRMDNQPGLIQCESCHQEYCIQCSLHHSDRVTCAEANENKHLGADARQAQEATEQWIKANTKSCPGCHASVQRIDGCNHMKCTQCPSHFCFQCNATLTVDPYLAGTLTCGCPIFPR